jgi:hypothetical protein
MNDANPTKVGLVSRFSAQEERAAAIAIMREHQA